MDRRRFLLNASGTVFAVAASGGLLSACGGDDEQPSTGAKAAGSIADEQGELQVFEYAGYDKAEFWASYKAEYGAEHPPKFTLYATDDEAITKVRSGFKPDIAHPCSGRVKDWVDAGLLQPIDTTKLTNFDSLDPALVEPGKFDGEQYWVPWDWGFSSLIVNTDEVTAPTDSWKLLWDTNYKGKISLWDNATTAMRIGGLYVGVEDLYDMIDEELEAVKAALIEQKQLNRNYWTAEADIVADLSSGNILITNGWTSAYLGAKDKGTPVEFGEPNEGRLAFSCGMVILKDTPRPLLAHAWIDAYLSVDASAVLSNAYGYGAANTKAIDKVDASRRDVFEVTDPAALQPPQAWLDAYFPRRDKYIQIWDEVKAS